MNDEIPQSYANHVRRDPWFHFVIVPIFAAAFVWSIVHLVRHPGYRSGGLVLLFFAALLLVFKARLYALKVQTRVIRLEERLRLRELLSEPLRQRIPELTEDQLIGLRFASDAECPALVEQALACRLSGKEIKKTVKSWRADLWRV